MASKFFAIVLFLNLGPRIPENQLRLMQAIIKLDPNVGFHTFIPLMTKQSAKYSLDKIVGLCKRRGFIFPSSEIYGGINGFYDYGPLGVEMRNNIKKVWWQDMVQRREDVVGLDCSIIMHPTVWKASGHIDGFSDPMVDCKESKMRFRADQLFFAKVTVEGELLGYISLLENEKMQEEADTKALELKKKLAKQGKLDAVALKDYTHATPDEYALIPSPATGKPGSLTPPRDFNLMFQTYVGALRDESAVAYLRPETAQGIFANFKNVVDTSRVKLPFGIAQIGKAFRNEITPRNFIFRSREFEQMEIEYFISDDADWKSIHRQWIDDCKSWLFTIGLKPEQVGEDVHPDQKLAHYAKACSDLTFEFPFGVHELWGIAARGNFDLAQHSQFSGKALEYVDTENKRKFIPHVVEPSLGVDRLMLALLCAGYEEDEVDGEVRTVLHLHPRIAPIKVAVLPLLKNKPELVERARALHKKLQKFWNVFYDETGAIGRRYRRMDEAGTPYCVTIDFDTIEKDGSITLRDRDTCEQVRMSEDDLIKLLFEKLS